MLEAIIKIYDVLGIDEPNVTNDIKCEILTENQARNGRPVLWYYGAGTETECAIYIDTLEELTQEEIEKELM